MWFCRNWGSPQALRLARYKIPARSHSRLGRAVGGLDNQGCRNIRAYSQAAAIETQHSGLAPFMQDRKLTAWAHAQGEEVLNLFSGCINPADSRPETRGAVADGGVWGHRGDSV